MRKIIFSKLLVPILIIIIIVLGSYILIKGNFKEKVTNENQATSPIAKESTAPLLIDKSLYEEKTYTDSTKYTTFKVTYPQFKNASAGFNQEIKNLVMEGIETHKKDSEDTWKIRYENRAPGDTITEFPKADEKFDFSVTWKPAQANAKFINLILTISGYNGGVHGYATLVSFNYDVAKKKEITLADLFPGDANYLKTVSEFSRKNLEAQFGKDLVVSMLNEGTMPTEDNFSVFTFPPDTITFYFNQYQVAPYAMGVSKVTMPRK